MNLKRIKIKFVLSASNIWMYCFSHQFVYWQYQNVKGLHSNIVLPSPFHSLLPGRKSWLEKWRESLTSIIWLGTEATITAYDLDQSFSHNTLKYRKKIKYWWLIPFLPILVFLMKPATWKSVFLKSSVGDSHVQPRLRTTDWDFSPCSPSMAQGIGPSLRGEWQSRGAE